MIEVVVTKIYEKERVFAYPDKHVHNCIHCFIKDINDYDLRDSTIFFASLTYPQSAN